MISKFLKIAHGMGRGRQCREREWNRNSLTPHRDTDDGWVMLGLDRKNSLIGGKEVFLEQVCCTYSGQGRR